MNKVKINLLMLGCLMSNALFADEICRDANGQHNIRYQGSLSGAGTITVKASDPTSRSVLLEVMVEAPVAANSDGVTTKKFIFRGKGSCLRGVVSADLGANIGDSDAYTILGGKLEGLLIESQSGKIFGHWQFYVLDTRNGKHHEINGFWTG